MISTHRIQAQVQPNKKSKENEMLHSKKERKNSNNKWKSHVKARNSRFYCS